MLKKNNQKTAALAIVQRLIAITEASHGMRHVSLVPLLTDQAALLEQLDRPDDAVAVMARYASITADAAGVTPLDG